MMQQGIIVQARMGSTRLPGKVLKNLVGLPMLKHVMNRLRAVPSTKVILATTTLPQDDVLEEFCTNENIPFYRGDSDNVLMRYLETAKRFEIDTICRITSDCPLIDSEVITAMLAAYQSGRFDYYSNTIERTYPRGLDAEIFSRSFLQRAWDERVLTDQVEHVVYSFVQRKSADLKIGQHHFSGDFSDLRWTVDEPVDFQLIEQIYNELYPQSPFFLFREILNLIEKKPELTLINQHINQKAIPHA